MKRRVKEKPCGYSKCRETFTPTRPLQRTCSKVKCAIGYARERQERRERRAARAHTRHERERLKTKPMLLKEAQREFNKFIRTRDAGLPCISCSRFPKLDPLTGGTTDCGHYRSTGAAPELRFNEDNAHGQCKHCNRHQSGTGADYRIGLVKRIGLARVEALEGEHPMPKWTHDELRAIRDGYRRRTNELRRALKTAA